MCTCLELSHLYILKYKWHIISERTKFCLQNKISIHDWFRFENTDTRNLESCDLNSYTHDWINNFVNRPNSITLSRNCRRSNFLFERFGFVPWGYWCSIRCWYIWLLNVLMVFEFLIFIGIEFHSFAPDTETAFCPTAVLR